MSASYDKLKSKLACSMYLDDPADATVARHIGWVPMGRSFLARCMLVSGTGVLTFKIFAATDASGSGATVVKAHPAPTDADAAGDILVLETSAEEVKAALAGATHVSVEMDNGAAGDVNIVDYIVEGGLAGGRFNYADLTADSAASEPT